MTPFSADYYEDIQERLRGVLVEVEACLETETTNLVTDMIDANECGLALEMLCEAIEDAGRAIAERTLLEIKALSELMGMDGGCAPSLGD